jgi:quercetin dioxygenase-like cupin family protein
MTNSSFMLKTVLPAVAVPLFLNLSALSQTPPQTPAQKHDRARVVRAASLPALDGNRLRATLVEVHYGPGESSPPHSHPCAVMGYVVQGSIRTQVEGEPLEIYKAGESFYELPGGIHAISANASSTESAEFVAYFVCDHETPLSADVPAQASNR